MRALFVAESGYGHLYPLEPIATGLRSAGHDVAFAVPGFFAEPARRLGFPVIPLVAPDWSPATPDYQAQQAERVGPQRGRAALARYLRNAVALTPALRAAAIDFRAQVIVRETTALSGWLVGELLGVPDAVLDFAAAPARLLRAMAGDLYADARAIVGLTPDPDLRSLHQWLHLLAAPAGWFPAASATATTHLFQPPDPPVLVTGEPPELTGLGRDRPLVYVTLGTMYNRRPDLFTRIFAGLADEPVDVVATTGPDLDPASIGPAPANVRVARFLPLAHVLARTAAVVCHAGYGTLMAALRRGIPVVVHPLAAADHAANARRVAVSGAGVVVSGGDSAGAVRAVLEEPAFRRAAARVAENIAALPPLPEAGSLLERLVAERRPIPAMPLRDQR
jgi:UDP:flavonoid glycosyltransferase YjiC (YdhE family)